MGAWAKEQRCKKLFFSKKVSYMEGTVI